MYQCITKKLSKLFSNLDSRNKLNSYFGGPIIIFDLSRDPISGTFGFDIFTERAMILWTIPGLPAHTAGILPRDIIVEINGIKITPGDFSIINTINQLDFISLAIIPSPFIFENPRLSWTWINHICKHGNKVTRTQQHVQTLSHKYKGAFVDAGDYFNTKETVAMQSRIYI